MTVCTFCNADATLILNFHEPPVREKPYIAELSLCEAHLKKLRYLMCGDRE